MKVVKLDNRHRLFKEGFTHAFRFTGWTDKQQSISRYFEKQYGYSWNNEKCYGTYWGKRDTNGSRVYWIGVRNETLITQALLAAGT